MKSQHPSSARGLGPALGLGRVLVLSDGARGFGLLDQLHAWPNDTAMIERTFGDAPVARPSRRAKRCDRQVRLATASSQQVRAAHLDGIHWPQKQLSRRLRSRCLGLVETASAHTGRAIAKAHRQGLTAILISTAFASDSPSAGKPLGSIRLARLQRAFPHVSLYALGGVNARTVVRLRHCGLCGIALVSFAAESRSHLFGIKKMGKTGSHS